MLRSVVERKRHTVSAFTIELARLIDGEMASRRPRWTRADLSRATGIDPSVLSRMLKPEKPMLVDELASICDALGLDLATVMANAQNRVNRARVDLVYPKTDVHVAEDAIELDVRSAEQQPRQERDR